MILPSIFLVLVWVLHQMILKCYSLFLKLIPLTNRVRGPYRKLRILVFPLRVKAQARSARAINQIVGEKRGSVTYGTDRGNEVSKIFIISLLCVWRVRERFPFMRNGFKFLKQVESKTNQYEIVFKSLARFTTQIRVKESLNFYLQCKLRKFGDKSLNIWVLCRVALGTQIVEQRINSEA